MIPSSAQLGAEAETNESTQRLVPLTGGGVLTIVSPNDVACGAKPPPTREQILKLENVLRTLPPVDLPVTHYHAKGLYVRELFIPAGIVLTGKVHKAEHISILTQGEIYVWTEQGMRLLKAPHIMACSPGTKRVGYAFTDTHWVTVHATDKTDITELEEELVEPNPWDIAPPVLQAEVLKCLSAP